MFQFPDHSPPPRATCLDHAAPPPPPGAGLPPPVAPTDPSLQALPAGTPPATQADFQQAASATPHPDPFPDDARQQIDARRTELTEGLGRALCEGRADEPTAVLALTALQRLPAALEALAARPRPLVPGDVQLQRLLRSIGTGSAHAGLVRTLHDAVLACPAQCAGPDKPDLHAWLVEPFSSDTLLEALAEAVQARPGVALDPQEVDDVLRVSTDDDAPRNLAFRGLATRALQACLDGTAALDWPGLLAAARQVVAEGVQASLDQAEQSSLEARRRPDCFGMPIREIVLADGTLNGPTGKQLERLPTAAELEALARRVAPGLVDPLRHMAALDPRPRRIELHYLPDPQRPGSLRPVTQLMLRDPDGTPVENALRLEVAARLLQECLVTEDGEPAGEVDRVAGTIRFHRPEFGTSNDVAIRLRDGPDGNDFLDSRLFAIGKRHNRERFFLPALCHSRFLRAGEQPAADQVTEIAHLAACVFDEDEEHPKPFMQFALRLGLPGYALPADTQRLRQALGALVGREQVCRNGGGTDSIAVAIKAAVDGGAGSFVDAQGWPGWRCRPEVGRQALSDMLSQAGLGAAFEVRQAPDGAWTAMALGLPAVAPVQHFPTLGVRQYAPLRLREGLPAAIDYAEGEQARAAVAGDDDLMRTLADYRESLRALDTAATQGGFVSLVGAAGRLLEQRWVIQQQLGRAADPASARTHHLAALAQGTRLALPVLERAGLLDRA